MVLQPKSFSERILVVGPSWLGDMVMSQSLFKALLQVHPGASIDVLAPNWSLGVIRRMSEVTNTIAMPISHGELRLWDRLQIARKLRQNQYSRAIVIPNSFKSALIPFWAKIPNRIGWLGEWRIGVLNDLRKLNTNRYLRMIDRFVALAYEKDHTLKEIIYPSLRVDNSNLLHLQNRFRLDNLKPILTLCPGAAFGSAKQWPIEYFAEVANYGLNRGWQVWLMGSAQEKKLAEKIQEKTQRKCHDFIGETTLEDSIDLLSMAKVVLCNDSGLMHVAAALNKNIIVPFGPTDEKITPPLTSKADILSISISCRPCHQRKCPLKHHHCLRKILPQEVIQFVERKML